MLIELKDVEVHIELKEVLTQALQEGDLTIKEAIHECINEEGVSAILDVVDNADIEEYAKQNNIAEENPNLGAIIRGIRELTNDDKAKVLWIVLQG